MMGLLERAWSMAVQMHDPSAEVILRRLDTIMRELEELRKMVLHAEHEPMPGDLAGQLFGVLGRGSWDEYDLDLEWQRFGP